MIVLSFDPGAFRAGWAVTQVSDGARVYIDSGVVSLPRGEKEGYQDYRERLVKFWAENFAEIADHFETLCYDCSEPDRLIAFEIVPAIGFKSGGAVQSQLAQAMATTCQALCEEWGWTWAQLSATSVKKQMTGFGDATKVQIRDAVLAVFPELEPRKRELTSTADESDAIAIGLVAGGYSVPKSKVKNPRRKKKS